MTLQLGGSSIHMAYKNHPKYFTIATVNTRLEKLGLILTRTFQLDNSP